MTQDNRTSSRKDERARAVIVKRDGDPALAAMKKIAKALDALPSDRARLLALAFFVAEYDKDACGLYTMAHEIFEADVRDALHEEGLHVDR